MTSSRKLSCARIAMRWNVIGRHASHVHSCQHWKEMVACEALVSIRRVLKLRLIYIGFNESQSAGDQRCCKSICITTSAKYLTSDACPTGCASNDLHPRVSNHLSFYLSYVWLHVDVCCSQKSWPNMMKSQALDIRCNKREKNLLWSFYLDFCRWTRYNCYWQIIFQGLKCKILKWSTRW